MRSKDYFSVRLFVRSGTGERVLSTTRFVVGDNAVSFAKSMVRLDSQVYRAVVDEVVGGKLVDQVLVREGER